MPEEEKVEDNGRMRRRAVFKDVDDSCNGKYSSANSAGGNREAINNCKPIHFYNFFSLHEFPLDNRLMAISKILIMRHLS